MHSHYLIIQLWNYFKFYGMIFGNVALLLLQIGEL